MRTPLLIIALTAGLAPSFLRADVSLPSIFSEHMVLQRSAKTPVWGKAAPGEKVEVSLLKGAETLAKAKTAAGADGRWQVALDLSKSALGGSYQVSVKAANTLSIPDVLIGDVWLASGQSNMAQRMRVSGSPEEIASSENSQIRFFTVANKSSFDPLDDVAGKWIVASPNDTPGFSAVAYYFARQINAETGTPIGVIHASWGGTPVEAWTSEEALKSHPDIGPEVAAEVSAARAFPETKSAWLAKLKPWLAANQREDRPTPEAELAGYTTSPTGEGWSAVKLPGKLPGDRILWVRRDVSVPESAVGKPFVLDFNEIAGLDTVYFDGKAVGGRTWETFDGDGSGRLNARRQYTVPADLVTPGQHTLAVRIYAPMGETAMNGGYFSAGGQNLSGEWLMKSEYEFPALSAEAIAASPGPLKAPPRPWNVSASLYNGMIHALVPYGLRGVIWYQGENNAGNGIRYRTTFPLLIQDWRKQWADADLPFYWVQLPNYGNKTNDANSSPGWAVIREAQSRTLKLPHTGQAVIIDAGEAGDVHPVSKREAGSRLAAIALAQNYGKSRVYAGPTYESMKVEGSAIRVKFSDLGGGLVARPVPAEYLHTSTPTRVTKPLQRNSPDSELEGFLIRGSSSEKWHWANARIEGDSVVVSSQDVPRPEAVRYAWFSNPDGNLYNKEGFPAVPFRTDGD